MSAVLQHGGSSGAQACASAPNPCSPGMHNNTESSKAQVSSIDSDKLSASLILLLLSSLATLSVHTSESRQEAVARCLSMCCAQPKQASFMFPGRSDGMSCVVLILATLILGNLAVVAIACMIVHRADVSSLVFV